MILYDGEGNEIRLDGDETSELEDLLTNRLLIWHDEFNGEGIDLTKWRAVYGYRNQYGTYVYPKDANRNTSVNKGLSYYALKDNPLSNAVYSCPFLDTNNLFEFRYGRIEA